MMLAEHGDDSASLSTVQAILEDAGKSEAAAAAYEKALKFAPNDPDLLLKVGIFALVKGDADRAVTLLLKRTRFVPRDEESFYYLAQAYHLEGNDEVALKTIRRASILAPNSAPISQKYGELLCSSGNNDEALRWLKKAKATDHLLEKIDLDLAIASYNNMDLDQAEAYASIETTAHPDDLDALALLAATKIKLRQWSGAKSLVERVIVSRKNDSVLLLELGQCQVELGEYNAAIATLSESIRLDPTQVQVHFFLAKAYAGLGQGLEAHHQAELHQRMLQGISFQLPKAEQRRQEQLEENARTLLGEHRETEALHLFEGEGKGSDPRRRNPYVSLGATYLSMGESEAARRSFHRALQIDPMSLGAHIYLGVLAIQQGILSDAAQEFEAELRIDHNSPAALAYLGEVRYRQENWTEAVDLFVKSKTTIPVFLYMLTDSYFHKGDVAAADLTAESLAAYARDQPEIMAPLIDLLTRNGEAGLVKQLPSR
jgi:Tfp pilus assembly protein PilF